MIREILKGPASRILQPLARLYLGQDRTYRAHGIKVTVRQGVFHPGLFLSTGILAKFLIGQELSQRTLLELGAGTGFLSILARKRGAVVTSSDVSKKAIENLKINARSNQVELSIVESDLFENIPPQTFDWIVINPPYYPQRANNEDEHAWFCGVDFEYFRRLFRDLNNYMNDRSRVIMILSEDCDLEAIRAIAQGHGFRMTIILEKQRWLEKNFVYQIHPETEG